MSAIGTELSLRRLKMVISLALFLFAFWLILSNDYSLWNILVGSAIAIIIAVVTGELIPTRMQSHFSFGFAMRAPVFFVLLIWEIVKSNWDVFRIVVAPSFPIDPQVSEFDTCLESQMAKTFLAGSINLTPGTITIEIEGSHFYVHCLAGSQSGDLLDGRLERMVAWLFREGPPESRRLR